MKNIISYFAIFSICFLQLAFAQGSPHPDPKIKFSYDEAGNRITRQIVYFTVDKINQENDTLPKPANDSTATANAINSAYNSAQNQNGNNSETTSGNNNGNTNGAGQYTDMLGDQQIVIYPNPTTGWLQVKITPFSTNTPAEITVYDLQSRLMLKEPCTKGLTIVDFSTFATASYIFLKIQIGEKQSEWKIVKQ